MVNESFEFYFQQSISKLLFTILNDDFFKPQWTGTNNKVNHDFSSFMDYQWYQIHFLPSTDIFRRPVGSVAIQESTINITPSELKTGKSYSCTIL